MNRSDSSPEFDDFKTATAEASPPSGLHERIMGALARREAARLRAARRFVGFSVSLAACVALASLGLALWQDAKFVDGLAHSPDVWIDGEVRDPMSMRVRLGLALAAVFVLGVVTGAAGWNFAGSRSEIDVFDAAREGSRHGVFVWSLERKLDLDASQKSRVLEILTAYDKASEAVKPQPTPQMKALKEKMRADVRAVLTPAQASEYDVLIAELDAVRGRSKAPASASPSASAAP